MCGIFSILNSCLEKKNIVHHFNKGSPRGPENSTLNVPFHKIYMGFHRLAINGLDKHSGQPMEIDNCVLICNGEIYNHKDIQNKYNIQCKTESDCEVIYHLYKKNRYRR